MIFITIYKPKECIHRCTKKR